MTDFVATLIARPENAADLAASVAACGAILPGARISDLAENEAVDLVFQASEDATALRGRIDEQIAPRPVDVIVQPAAARKKRLLVADMDSTIIGQECIDELADFAGFKTEVAATTERAMRGDIEFESALRERVALLAGLPESTIDRVIAERVRLTPGAKPLVWTMRANGAHTILVSGGFTVFAEKIAAMAGFDESRANRLLIADRKFTGKVAEPILGPVAKLAALEDAIIRLQVSAEETLAIGDGVNDLGMVKRAGLGVAYHAVPKLAAAASARIEHNDLTALLFAQGYRRHEFLG
jgi:phosphoserine phosphatase